ncbi:MAG: tRNA (N(6)-L-threonylcarbamoyladenosine(37)-C(2))-methylthiotransferase MtaB, partial [Anaeroplasmataceae bacterium]|nr:tRNA (N(6)-L-threonylcarbamoyladenosine(37)-C(2))-methylthiotransferase MtaB [Anaeroplasmataceae bacterium]
MKKIGFVTLGCKVNIYESNALKNELIKKGYEVGEPTSFCDAFIINTCSVTNMADAKSRRMIHRLAKLNPNAVLCVMGCYSQTNKEALDLDGVDILVGNGNKLDIIPMLEDKLLDKSIEKRIAILDILNHKEYEPLEVTTYDHTRAFVKIEDGCENFCTYCIIPYARGPVRSKPASEVVAEIKRIVKEGYLEVVLAGIHTGRYQDGSTNLSSLIQLILKEIPELERLRLSSIEINEVDDAFIKLMENSKILADHLHLPLQSGSDLVLEKMERKYNTEFFLNKIEKIRSVRPDISITTDVIVGFPYETEEEFNFSMEFIKKVNFSKLHVFPYSMRKGTKACSFLQIQDSIKKERTNKLIALSKSLELAYAKKFLGNTMEVLIEQI